jgi:hypothetical protein
MKAIIKVEAIGNNIEAMIDFRTRQINDMFSGLGTALFGEWKPRCGVYAVTKKGLFGMNCKTDYSHSNSVGSRGVYKYYTIESGRFYFVRSPISWGRTDEFFCTVDNDGNIKRVTEQETIDWLENTSE